jgi:hypothetical protein
MNYPDSNRRTSINSCRKIKQYSLDGAFIKEWNSLKEAAVSLGLHSPNILKVCIGERKKCGGFKWKYK